MRKACFVANWKMNKTIAEADQYLLALEKRFRETPSLLNEGEWEAILAPPFTALGHLFESLRGSSLKISLAAQNVFFEEKGPYTGEVSADMLREVGCRYVIIGHSERRRHFGETGGEIRRKIRSALKSHLAPILCIGETLEERGGGKTWPVIERQLKEAVGEDFPSERRVDLIIAYEPVWAIGTGRSPLASEVETLHRAIRNYFRLRWGGEADALRILYGGSVILENIEGFMKEADIDGALVGGASLSAEIFFEIVASGATAKNKT